MTSQPRCRLQENIKSIVERMKTQDTRSDALEEYSSLLMKATSADVFIALGEEYDNINSSNKEILILLPLVFTCKSNITIHCLNNILSLLKKSIVQSNSSIFHLISKIYGQIVLLFFQNESNKAVRNKSHQALYAFCVEISSEAHQNAQGLSLLLLTELIDNSSIVTEPAYVKSIWLVIDSFRSRKGFDHKLEAMNCLLSLIYSSEELFKPYVNDALYGILDSLLDKDWLKRKLALNVIYTCCYYCYAEIVPFKEELTEALSVSKTDEVDEVREMALQTVELFKEKSTSKRQTGSLDLSIMSKHHKSMSNSTDLCLNNKSLISEQDKNCNHSKLSNDNVSDTKSLQYKRREEQKTKQRQDAKKPVYTKNEELCLQYTSNDIYLILTKKLVLKSRKAGKEVTTHSPGKIKSHRSQGSVQTTKANKNVSQLKSKKVNESRNKQKALSQPKLSNGNDKSLKTQREMTMNELSKSNAFNRLHNSPIKNPKKRLKQYQEEAKNIKTIIVNKTLSYSNIATSRDKHINLTQREISKEKRRESSENKALNQSARSNSSLNQSQSENKSGIHINTLNSTDRPSQASIEAEMKNLISELINQIKQIDEKQNINQSLTNTGSSLPAYFSLLMSRLASLEESLKSIMLLHKQSTTLRLIQLLIDHNDYDKAIMLMLHDHTLLLKSISKIKRHRYTSIPRKTLEALLVKLIEIISYDQGIDKILDVLLIILNDKLSISHDIKESILKAMEYLLSNKKDLLNEHCCGCIRFIISHLSNKL